MTQRHDSSFHRRNSSGSGSSAADGKITRAVRQGFIAELLESQGVTSQSQIVGLLADQGIKTTQVTVSRDLEEMGATKVPTQDGGFAYVLDNQIKSLSEKTQGHLRRVVKEWVHSVDKSRDLVVLRTAPGAAHVVAAAVDRSKHPAVLATISGDDTVLLIVQETHEPAALQEELASLVGLG